MHQPTVGQTARRTRTVTARDIELFTELTGDGNPLHDDDELATPSRVATITRADGVVALKGRALVWREVLERGPDR